MFQGKAIAAGSCSVDYLNRVTINEVRSLGGEQWVELKLLDASIPPSVYNSWSITVCENKNSNNCSTYVLGSSAVIQNWPYLVINNVSHLNLSLNGAMDILLKDGNGDYLDYLVVNQANLSRPPQDHSCTEPGFPYPTTLATTLSQLKGIARAPDGTGPWMEYEESGAQGEATEGDSNDTGTFPDGTPIPRIVVSDVMVAKGDAAAFVVQLQDEKGTVTSFPYAVHVDYKTLNYTAFAGIDYVAKEGTAIQGSALVIPAGTSAATIDIQTLEKATAPDGSVFFVVLSNPVYERDGGALNALLMDHFATGTLNGTLPSLDHFHIDHPGSALTCQRADVTIRACQAADCKVLYPDPVSVTLSPTGWIGGTTQTIAGGAPTVFQLRHNTAGTVTLDVTASDVPAAGPVQCTVGGVAASCDLLFSTAGFLFEVPPQTSCQDSADLTIAAVKADPADPQACVGDGSFAGQSKAVSFWSSYVLPASGSRALQVNGTAVATGLPGTPLTLSFDGSARSSFRVAYADAGQVRLDARYEGSGEEAGLVMEGNDTFTVKPYRLDVLATVDGLAPLNNSGSTGEPKLAAGLPFQAELRGVCQDGSLAPNFAAATTLSAVAPFAPAPGVLSGGSLSAADFSGGAATALVSYSEVGTLTLQADVADYLGAGSLSGTSATVGRFTPHHFDVVPNSPQFAPTCGPFSYLGQPFTYATAPVLQVIARNAGGAITRNYTGAWWKLSGASLAGKRYLAENGTLDESLLPATDPVILDQGDGTGTLTFDAGGGLGFVRTTLTAPFAAEIRLEIDVIDEDGIVYAGNPAAFGEASAGNGIAFTDGTKEMRFGRLTLQNAYGSELIPLNLPLRAEYFDGSIFVGNLEDSCTPYDGSLAVLSNYTANLQAGETNVAGAGSLLGGVDNPLSPLQLSAPGIGNDGSVDVSLPVDFWLQYDWDGDGALDNDPSARASFGIFKGNSRMIYWGERVR
ncbi:MAG: DUF6701 domain-containing protein [Desulfuromonadales bacterium]|nr:DUF6701 domain-containing protein [Desulfuromonadales bacterium]